MENDDANLEPSDAEKCASRLRLKRAREAAEKEPGDLGFLVGGDANYWDLETCDDELYVAPSLRELAALCSTLGIKPWNLFSDHSIEGQPISPEELVSKTKDYINRRSISVQEFGDRIGFEIEPTFNNVSEMMEWNVDFLRWLCLELGLDWRLALPSTS